MKTIATPYGRVHCLPRKNLYAEILLFINHAARRPGNGPLASIALTGGSTPQAFYHWVVQHPKLWAELGSQCLWTSSDERCVPLNSADSNFGNADRMLLQPLDVPAENKLPWPVDLPPAEAVSLYTRHWRSRVDPYRAYDLCLLGVGDDCHTASLFPGCPLIGSKLPESFAAVEWPGKGWRLTLTPEGLGRCQRILVCVTGKGKATALKRIFHGGFNPRQKPAQLLKAHAYKTDWLVDEQAASMLDF